MMKGRIALMPDWNALFAEELHIKRVPEAELYKFILLLEGLFPDRPLRLWDVGCGAGRHTVAMTVLGHDVHATDPAPRAVSITQQWLQDRQLRATVVQADMTVNPWPDVTFHGVLGWDSLYHDVLANIQKAIDGKYRALVPGGLLMATMKSDKADLYGRGLEVEPK